MPEIAEQELKQEGLAIVHLAQAVTIKDQDSYDEACRLLQEQIVPFRRRWKEYWENIRKPAYAAYQAILAKIREGDEPAERAEIFIKAQIRKWDDEQTRIEQERQRQAQIEAEKVADEERLQAAIYAKDAGASQAEVEAIVSAPMAVVAAPVVPSYQRAAGVSKRENWKAQVNDLWALVKAAAKDKGLLPYLLPNETALNARARAEKSTLNIPGVLAYNEPVVSARGR